MNEIGPATPREGDGDGGAPPGPLRRRRADADADDPWAGLVDSDGGLPNGGGGRGRRGSAFKRGSRLGAVAGALTVLAIAGAAVGAAVWAGNRAAAPGPTPALPRRVFTPDELALHDGTRGRGIYLAVLGEVYDVSAGRKHYGADGAYAHFAGRDASRSFITGDFTGDLTDDTSDFDADQLAALLTWRDFYAKHKVYRRVGSVVGRFFTADGTPTLRRRRVEDAARAAAEAEVAAAGGDPRAAGVKAGVNSRALRAVVGRKPRAGPAADMPEPCVERASGAVVCTGSRHPRWVPDPGGGAGSGARCACFRDQLVSPGRQLPAGCTSSATACEKAQTPNL